MTPGESHNEWYHYYCSFFMSLRIRTVTFQIFQNQNCFMYYVDHNDIFDYVYFAEPDNLLNIENSMYLTKVVFNF